MAISFREYIKNKSKQERKEIVEFIEKYTLLMSTGSTVKFGLVEQPMTVKEALTSRDAQILLPKVMEGVLEQAAEPIYLASKLFKTVKLEQGSRIIFPAIGALRAYEIGETQEYPTDTLDIMLKEKATEVDVTKKGVLVPISEELINDSQWDVIGMHIQAAGRALARLKEELIFKAMSKHGHVVFDNKLRRKYPEAGTTGRNEHGEFNDTLAIEDLFDIIVALMANEYTPTDILIHPLTWSVFVKNGLISVFDKPALGSKDNIKIDKNAANGRIPFALNLMVSPFIPFDQVNRTFDMYVIDRHNVGVIVEKEGMTTEDFTDPYRDIRNLKFKERYGIGILDQGKAVATARNIALDVTYEKPMLVRTINESDYASGN